MNKLSFAIGILSWKGYDSLENSLYSYKSKKYPGGFLKCKPYAKIVTRDMNKDEYITGIIIDSEDENNELFIRTNTTEIIEEKHYLFWRFSLIKLN